MVPTPTSSLYLLVSHAMLLHILQNRVISSLVTFPTAQGWLQVAGITVISTATAGAVAVSTRFIDQPIDEAFDPVPFLTIYKPVSAFLFPCLTEELVWRAAFIPVSALSSSPSPLHTYSIAAVVWAVHVLAHPVAAATVWPRGRPLFGDVRFLASASLVLAGATVAYMVTGGSVWAAAVAHWVPVVLWRDVFGGEARLLAQPNSADAQEL